MIKFSFDLFSILSVILRRMSDFEQPLVLRLLWGGADIRHNFSLQENETGDIVVSDCFTAR